MKILLIEDNPGDAQLIKEYLKFSNIDFKITECSRLNESIRLLHDNVFDVILLDLGLPDSMGIDTLRKLQNPDITVPAIIVLTGLDDEVTSLDALKEGAQDYLVKSKLNTEKILNAIKFSIERKNFLNIQQKLTRQFSTLSHATASFTESDDAKTIYKIICKSITDLQKNTYVVAFDFIKNTIVRVIYSKNIDPYIKQIQEFAGLNLNEAVFYKNDVPDKVLELFKDSNLHKFNGGLCELTSFKYDKNICLDVEKLLDISNIYLIGFSRNDVYYGGLVILSKQDFELNDINIIEAISSQASLNIHRRAVEKAISRLNAHLEFKVQERTKDLRELIATKDKFFGIIAHDLKNPFSGLLGASEILSHHSEEYDPESLKGMTELLYSSAKNVYAMLENLLEWARSQTGNIKYQPEEILIKDFVAENLSNVRTFAENKGIKLFNENIDGMQIVGDRNMLNTVLRNLLNNAIKFTKVGGTIYVSTTKTDNEVIFSIQDNGIGIPKHGIDKLFRIDEKYCRNGTNTEHGTGMGLILCKEFVERHNGKIWVESEEDIGSNFKFSIPV